MHLVPCRRCGCAKHVQTDTLSDPKSLRVSSGVGCWAFACPESEGCFSRLLLIGLAWLLHACVRVNLNPEVSEQAWPE